jgi:nucleoid-associated protein EbfC
MGMFDKAKDMYKLQKQAKEIKKKLKNMHIEANVEGIIVTIDGEQNVVSVKIPPEMLTFDNKEKLEKNLESAFNKAIKKSQQIAAEEMKVVMGGMGIPGMGS